MTREDPNLDIIAKLSELSGLSKEYVDALISASVLPDPDEEYPDETRHRDGVWWFDAPLPRRWHRCSPWTQAWHGPYNLQYVERCACGAMRLSTHDGWGDKNSRRKNGHR